MRTRSIVRWTLLVALVLPLLAVGCAATGAPQPTVSPAETEASAEVPKPTEQPAETEVSQEPSGKVTFITHADHPFEVRALLQAVDEFVSQHPDIKVICTIVIPAESWVSEESELCAFVLAQ